MAEVYPTIPSNEKAPSHQLYLIEGSLVECEQQGFALDTALRSTYGESKSPEDLQIRAEQTKLFAASIAEDMQLEPSFYAKPYNTVLLLATAESWLENEQNAPHRSRIETIHEREALNEFMCALAGSDSAVLRQWGEESNELKDRYIVEQEGEIDARKERFLGSIVDRELSEEVTGILLDAEEGGVLQQQRQALNIVGEGLNFSVKVIKAGTQWDLEQAGMLEPVSWPKQEEYTNRDDYIKASDHAASRSSGNSEAAKEYEDNIKAYDKEFADEFGEMPVAWVSTHSDGRKEMYIRAADAFIIKKAGAEGVDSLTDDQKRSLATMQHEYGHTAKTMMIGARHQLGRLLEERKAELISGDKHGYQDIKYFFMDMSMVNGVDVVNDSLANALRQDDPISAFTIDASTKIGLRNTLLSFALHPTPYDKNPDIADKFVQFGAVQDRHLDASQLDFAIRETIGRKGEDVVKEFAAEKVELMRQMGVNMDFMNDSWLMYRKMHGLSHVNPYIRVAIEQVIDSSDMRK
ncbi:hypothetical protein KBC77_01205 [Candidatus Saccharibacteria bacterium]|nr:hypothetical protein [Candidatus Saccharibacteria bacterium]